MSADRSGAEDYRRLLDNANSIILRFDPRGLVTYMNPFGLRFFGFAAEELFGRELIGTIVPPTESTGRDLREMIRAIAEHPEVFSHNENENLCRDGRRAWVSWTNQGLFDSKGRLEEILAIGNDVTERRRTERELEESRRMLRTILDTISVRVFWKDLDLKYLGGNLAFARDAGLTSPEQLVGLSDLEMVWAGEAQLYHAEDRRIIETGQPVLHLDEPQTRPDGGQMWVRASIFPLRDREERIIGLLGTYEDVTERRAAEEALLRAKEDWERTFDAVPDLIAIIDHEHRVLRVNHALAERAGRQPGDCIGEFCHLLLHDTPLPLALCPGRQSFGDGRIHSAEVYEERLGRHYLVTTVPLADESGRIGRLVQLAQDITERKQAEESRRRLETQVQQAQKLESLGVLAGGIAHDFNNLLMAILGNADLALRELSPGSPARQSVEEIEQAARRAAELTRQMLAYSGKGRLEVRALDLAEGVREMAHILRVSISKKVALQFRFAEALPPAEADAAQLRQVILNLIVNASEAIGDRTGTITVTTGTAHLSGNAESWPGGPPAAGDYVYLEVADTGSGMDRKTMERIFDPFFTTKFTGRGLGLAVVLGIVRGHGGAIRVTSAPDRGTSFRVFLPISTQAPDRSGVETGGSVRWQGSGTVLLADDEPAVRAVGIRMLEHLGFKVVPVANGEEALEAVRADPGRFVCAILDLTMPRLDGAEALVSIRGLRPDLPVLLTSGYSEEAATSRFGRDPRVVFLQKPYELADFAERLRHLLEPE